MNGKTRLLCSALALTGILLAGPVLALDKVRYILPTSPNIPSMAPPQIAKHLGYYEAEGLDVEFIVGKGGVDAASQVGAGNAEFAGGIGDTSMIVRANRVPVKGVMLLGDGALMALAVRDDAGVDGLKDLKGKSVSVLSFQDTTYYALLGMLGSVGLAKSDVDAQSLGPSGMTQMFVSGQVQAMAALPDFVVTAEDAGTKFKVYASKDFTPSMAQAILTSDKLIAENPDLVRRFIRATNKAFTQFRHDPAGMTKAFVATIPSLAGKEAYLERVFALYGKLAYGNQKVPGAFDPAKLDKLQKLYSEVGVLRTTTPVEELYTNAFVTGQ
jgi:NitT/TauT family transport system substrate-binding protein